MPTTREAVMQALFALASGAYDFATASRRLKLWDNVAPCDMPALFQFEGAQDDSLYEEDLLRRRTLKARLFVYIDAKDESVIGASAINDILDALDSAFAPSSFADRVTNRQTLGGLVSSARIVGPVLKDPGDLDGIGLIVAPVEIVLP
ncbi:MAG TPA: hypothetical protein VG271_19700 [Beijerinckiaceae bacterium]|jgi:hypothetical protein|nr:hypothetical protein [Beijerinckiaceae bacterium]